MLSLIFEVMALGLGMIISPGIFALAVIFLSSKTKPLYKSFSFLLGNIPTLIILFLIWFFIGTNAHNNWPGAVRFFDILFGFLLLIFAYRIYFSRERTVKKKKYSSGFLFCFVLGFLCSITNFDAETLYLISINEIFESTATGVTKLFLSLYSSIMMLVPILLPIVIYLLFPRVSKKVLDSLNKFLRRYGRLIVAILFTILGIWFLIKGFSF